MAEAYNYINVGKMPEARDELDRIVKNEIDFFVHKYKSLMPKVFISYDRIAMYGITDKSFRVTFDSNIRTRRYDLSLDKGIYGDLLMPADCWLMEVKTKDSIPLWFASLLSKYRIYPVSFSKYGTEYKNFITGCKDEKKREKRQQIICLSLGTHASNNSRLMRGAVGISIVADG